MFIDIGLIFIVCSTEELIKQIIKYHFFYFDSLLKKIIQYFNY